MVASAVSTLFLAAGLLARSVSVPCSGSWLRCGACHCACVRVCGRIHRFRDSEDGLGSWFPCRRILGRISGHQRDSEAGSANWALVAVEIVIAAVLFVVFWNVEKRQKAPMVTTHYLKQRRTWGLLLTTLLTMTGVFAS